MRKFNLKIRFLPNLLKGIILIGAGLLMSVSVTLPLDLLIPLFSLMLLISISTLMGSLKRKEFTTVKKWVVQHMDNDPSMVMRKIYDSLYGMLKPASIPEAVLIIAKYMKDITIVPDQEINLLACLTEIMMSCEFK